MKYVLLSLLITPSIIEHVPPVIAPQQEESTTQESEKKPMTPLVEVSTTIHSA